MSVAMCISLRYATKRTIEAVCEALAEFNAELYARGTVTTPPWSWRWVPDELVVCDATVCRVADTSTLADVSIIEPRGAASCGPLACAYVAWLRVHEGTPARIEAQKLGDGVWHVTARGSMLGRAYVWDPQVIGANHHGK